MLKVILLSASVLLACQSILAAELTPGDVAANLKADKVWTMAGWSEAKDMAQTDLIKARQHIERIYDSAPERLPGGESGGRMMLRYLNTKIPKNTDKSRSLEIKAVCVYPKSVSVDWTDKDGKKHLYAVSEKEMEVFPEAIKKQMDKWADVLFDISGGKLSLEYRVVRSENVLDSLNKSTNDSYGFSSIEATKLIRPKGDVMLYIFWIPIWDGHPPMGVASFSDPVGKFTASRINVYTNKDRLLMQGKYSAGWVNLDGGLPHESWHYLTHLARDNGFKGFMPQDDPRTKENLPARYDWETKLKPEIVAQGLPVPATAHEDQYLNILTWNFIDKLRAKYNR